MGSRHQSIRKITIVTIAEPKTVLQTKSDDGYNRRKYGQKVAKGNQHPRSRGSTSFPGSYQESRSFSGQELDHEHIFLLMVQSHLSFKKGKGRSLGSSKYAALRHNFPVFGQFALSQGTRCRYNFLNGSIPYGLGQGSIPTSLFQHPRIHTISLASNNLGGEMWTGQWYAPDLRVLDLRVLDLRNSSLRGIIPPSVENSTKLLGLSLASNKLTGSIPAALLNISSLLHMNLANNSLPGPLLVK